MDEFRLKYAAARERRQTLWADRPAPPQTPQEHRTCPWCHEYAPMSVDRIKAAEGPLSVVVRRCQLCGRSTSRLEHR